MGHKLLRTLLPNLEGQTGAGKGPQNNWEALHSWLSHQQTLPFPDSIFPSHFPHLSPPPNHPNCLSLSSFAWFVILRTRSHSCFFLLWFWKSFELIPDNLERRKKGKEVKEKKITISSPIPEQISANILLYNFLDCFPPLIVLSKVITSKR